MIFKVLSVMKPEISDTMKTKTSALTEMSFEASDFLKAGKQFCELSCSGAYYCIYQDLN